MELVKALVPNRKYRVYSPTDVSMFDMDNAEKELTLERIQSSQIKVTITGDFGEDTALAFTGEPYSLSQEGPECAFTAENEVWKITVCTPPRNAPVNKDNKQVLATLQLYQNKVLYGMYHVVDC